MPDEDPERLLAEALRAQATRTPVPDSAISGYGLLSGNDLPLPENTPTTRIPRQTTTTTTTWVLALALLLGLAAGTVIGLITLL
ncbi:hypothetical protein [Actinokineospora pegani]|uniref:hypothetical protein n=1 Tax=Actinokineospora pegani TaxID=2654637 RepID=UPI0012EA0367|nr:hypothetical protein [Actinokineospora pegani]